MKELLILAAALASLTWVVASVLPQRISGPWLLGLVCIAAWLAPYPYGDAVGWLGLVVVGPIWAVASDKKGRKPVHDHQAGD